MEERICLSCGEVFLPRRKDQRYCGKIKLATCTVCGKEFERKCAAPVKMTCSRKCNIEYIKIQQEASSQKETKMCKFCGKEFRPKSSRSEYCNGPHYSKCVVCGKEFHVLDVQSYVPQTCSDECRWILSKAHVDNEKMVDTLKKTMMDKYGVENAMDLQSSKDKIVATNREKYGADYYTQTDEYRQKVKQTNLEKYGVDHHLKSQEVRNKINQTVSERYGVNNVSKSDDIRGRIKDRIFETYRVKNIGQRNIRHLDDWNLFISSPEQFIVDKFNSSTTISDICDYFGVTVCAVYNNIDVKSLRIKSLISFNYSKMESEVVNFIKSLNSQVSIIQNDRTQISPYELDIYIPELSLAIECNPTETHNSSECDPWGGVPKAPSYHKMKSEMCREKGIFLFHIFGHEWTNNREVLQSMLRNLLRKNEKKIYSRKCEVKEVANLDAVQFLNDNHRQGYATSSTRLGLYYEDQLVSLMTFGKMRNTIGTGKESLSDCVELIRFCNLKNTSVVGGASKLFKYYVENYSPTRIRSFSDIAHTQGTLYPQLGFEVVRESDPGYVWVDSTTDMAYNRVRAQKHNLKNLLNDSSIDLSKSEKAIMEEHGFVKVYDCGALLWEWTC